MATDNVGPAACDDRRAADVTLYASRLTKRFGGLVAVDGLDLDLRSGEIFGLLGPNAAGKTTTIRLLAGILRATSGSARVLGMDLVGELGRIKPRIGYVAQHFALYPELTVRENLKFYGRLYGRLTTDRQTELLAAYGLKGFADRPAAQLSGGYKRRLSIVCAVSHDPDLIFLDEPTAGIDPVTRKELWDLFYDLSTTGKTLFVTTHYMEEAERCHRLAFLSAGRRVAYGSPAQIRGLLAGKQVYAFDSDHDPQLMAQLENLDHVLVVNRFGNTVRVVGDDGFEPDRLRACLARWPGVRRAPAPAEATLEDVFIALTRHRQ